MKLLQVIAIFFLLVTITVQPFLLVLLDSPVSARRDRYTRLKEAISEVDISIEKRRDSTKMITPKHTTKNRVVTFERELSETEIAEYEQKYQVKFSKQSRKKNRYIVVPETKVIADTTVSALLAETMVATVENEDIYKVAEQTLDWGIPQMNVQTAWESTIPASGQGIVVAVIDTGVQADHPDLVDTVIAGGYDFVNNDSDPSDDNGHGTHVAGTIAANNNSIGYVGVAYSAKILPFKVCDEDGLCSSVAISDAIDAAVDANVDVINLSLGGSANSLIQTAVNRATTAGITVVAASGNSGVNGCLFPAAYANVVCVGATTTTNTRAEFSNYGTALEVMAPGVAVSAAAMGDTYASMSGTSMAAAYYSGTVAVVRGMLDGLCVETPGHAACADKRTYARALMNQIAVKDLGTPGRDDQFGHGLVDLSPIFTATNPTFVSPRTTVARGTTYTQSVTIANNNAYPIAITSCTITSRNQTRSQTTPVFAVSEFKQGSTVYSGRVQNIIYTTYPVSPAVTIPAGESRSFSYKYTISSGASPNDSIAYSFVCTSDNTATGTVESYRSEVKTQTVKVDLPATLKNVYFVFGRMSYNKTYTTSHVRRWDIIYLKNYDPKKLRVRQMFLYDYTKKGNQGYTRYWRNSTSMSVRTNYLLPRYRKYAYVIEFEDIATGARAKKYFVFYTK